MQQSQARAFTRRDLPALRALIAGNARARWPHAAYLMTSDVAWQLPGSAPKRNVRLWFDSVGAAGYAWFQPGTTLLFDLRADLDPDCDLAAEILAWGESRRCEFGPGAPFYLDVKSMEEWQQRLLNPRPVRDADGVVIVTSALESDGARTALLERSGYERVDHFEHQFARGLDAPIREPELPAGAIVRHVLDGDFVERVATHVDSWIGSSFDLDRYLLVRESADFDPELDLVLETRDGTFAGYCIAWADRDSGIGSFEPVGARPAWRGHGVARQVSLEGLRRQKKKGMHAAIVSTAGFNDPACTLYRSCGFEKIDQKRMFCKRLG